MDILAVFKISLVISVWPINLNYFWFIFITYFKMRRFLLGDNENRSRELFGTTGI